VLGHRVGSQNGLDPRSIDSRSSWRSCTFTLVRRGSKRVMVAWISRDSAMRRSSSVKEPAVGSGTP
jgi:hypothetical protein